MNSKQNNKPAKTIDNKNIATTNYKIIHKSIFILSFLFVQEKLMKNGSKETPLDFEKNHGSDERVILSIKIWLKEWIGDDKDVGKKEKWNEVLELIWCN